MSLSTPESVQKLQTALHDKAKEAPNLRFYALYDKVYRKDVLAFAYECCEANGGAAGVDGQTILYDFRGGAWMILPLAWVIERACNGVWHVGWTIRFHEYSPGLVSSILMWMNLYFVVRYHPADQVVSSNIRIPVVVI